MRTPTRSNKKLYSGTCTSPRELQAMQADVEMLKRQRSELEDQELEVMEQRETLDSELAALDARDRDACRRPPTQLRADDRRGRGRDRRRDRKPKPAARATAAAPIADALLADYERRRAQNRGAGAARLVGMTCQACHLTIPSTEAEQIRRGAGATIAYCDNCGAILVP